MVTSTTKQSPQQPDLRSFIVYDTLPVGCQAFAIEDDGVAPHLRVGDVAIIDTTDREPIHGELFVVQWRSGRARPIEVRRSSFGFEPIGDGDDTQFWSASIWTTMVALDRSAHRTTRFEDGPYPVDFFRDMLLGRIVGILADTREMA